MVFLKPIITFAKFAKMYYFYISTPVKNNKVIMFEFNILKNLKKILNAPNVLLFIILIALKKYKATLIMTIKILFVIFVNKSIILILIKRLILII